MPPDELTVVDPDGLTTVVHRWMPPAGTPRAALHILHGWAEHGLRYDRPATAFAASGLAVYADDHRGHGQSGVRSGTLGDLGPRGMDGVLDAAHTVTDRLRKEHPDLQVFVLGHSWGSFLLQRFLLRWADELSGALLTGTTRREPAEARQADARDRATPGGLNDRFAQPRTAYDWLSRDEEEVDRYIADPLCGFEMMRSSPTGDRDRRAWFEDETGSKGIPPSLPIFVFNGADDPVGGDAGGRRLADHYRSLGVEDVTFRSYPGGRHELFNETNRDEVVADVLAWLDAHVAVGA